jgi:hypothetical protein
LSKEIKICLKELLKTVVNEGEKLVNYFYDKLETHISNTNDQT